MSLRRPGPGAIAISRVADPDVDRALRDQARAMADLQRQASATLRIVRGVELPDGIEVSVAHGLGRPPNWVRESNPRGAITSGVVEEVRTATERDRYVVLRASGFGGTVTLDLLVG